MEAVTSLRQKLAAADCGAFLISGAFNRRYISGFTGSAGVLWITQERKVLVVDFRYTEQAKEQARGFEVLTHDGLEAEIQKLIAADGIQAVAVEGEHVNILLYEKWKDAFEVPLKSVRGWVEELRAVKGPEEIENIRRAAAIADEAFQTLLPSIRSGAVERDLGLELEYQMRRLGASASAFDPIVASGPRSALPHARPTDRILQHDDFVVFDFGCSYNGYCSDMTRTLVVGEPSEKHLAIYDLVLQAQLAALDAIVPGKTGIEVDTVARNIISEGGYGAHFGHGLGHSLGLEVHENPRFNKLDQTKMQPGMVMTVEPGIYLPGWNGVRIEDLIVVTEDGCDVLSSTPKEMHIVD